MRVAFPSGTRSAPTDRNPSTVANALNGNATGGGVTTLGTYTVPAGRRADITLTLGTVITVALVAAQNASGTATFTPSGGGAQTVWRSQYIGALAVNNRDDAPAIRLQMKAGDAILLQIQADAGAGTIQGAGGVQGVEYDA